MFDMHPPGTIAEIRELAGAGISDCETSRRLGVPRSTVRDIRRRADAPRGELCPRCWERAREMRFTTDDYCELLGLYLGDGCISSLARTTSLRIALDQRYPEIVSRAGALLSRCVNGRPVQLVSVADSGVQVVQAYSRHWPCLFPQHGAGPKHRRRIVLEAWQQELVDESPWALLRGLVFSDGCRFPNRTGKYTYWSYSFTNYSTDILDLFCSTCEAVEVRFRRHRHAVRINRRADVAAMDRHIGPKH